MNIPDAIGELENAVESLRQAWDDHDCADEAASSREDELATAWDDGRDDLKRKLLSDIETWKRQAAIGLVPGTWSLEEMEDWVNRA